MVCASALLTWEHNVSVGSHGVVVVWLQIDKDREANVTDAAITTLGALAAQLPWLQYEQLLNQWLKVMKKVGTKVS